jgi:hypothetical protein
MYAIRLANSPVTWMAFFAIVETMSVPLETIAGVLIAAFRSKARSDRWEAMVV